MKYVPSPKTMRRYIEELADIEDHVQKILFTSAYPRMTMRIMTLKHRTRRLKAKIEGILERQVSAKIS